MTQEEKAKAYDEAIKKAKEIAFDPNRLLQIGDFEELFPGISEESEDERIRKELIEQVGYIIPDKEEYDDEGCVLPTYHKRIGRYRAWLEKQKEQPTSVVPESIHPKFSVGDTVCRNGWSDHTIKEIYLCVDPLYICKNDEGLESHIPFSEQDKWTKKEHKPAEWSEDWREEDIQTRFAFYTYKDDSSVLYLSNVFVEETSRNHGFGTRILRAAEKVAETIGAITISLKVKQDSPANAWYRKNGYGYVAFEDGYDWLEKNLEYLKPVKSEEWSGDDEEMIKMILGDLEWERRNTTVDKDIRHYDEEIAWLKSLRPQPKVEWSKEDTEMYINVASSLRGYACGLTNEEHIKHIKRGLNWLENRFKSLRPSWKPSEEQMEALKNSAYGTYQNGDGPALRELYEQLKKL